MWGSGPLVEYKELLFTNSILCWSQQRVDLDCQQFNMQRREAGLESCGRILDKICQFSELQPAHRTKLTKPTKICQNPQFPIPIWARPTHPEKAYQCAMKDICPQALVHDKIFSLGLQQKRWVRLPSHDISIVITVMILISLMLIMINGIWSVILISLMINGLWSVIIRVGSTRHLVPYLAFTPCYTHIAPNYHHHDHHHVNGSLTGD